MAITEHKLESAISAATVFQNRAIITRTGKIKLVEGDNRITLKDLPAELVENSVRDRKSVV
jgi:hypothetical protein